MTLSSSTSLRVLLHGGQSLSTCDPERNTEKGEAAFLVQNIPIVFRPLREADNGIVNILVHGYAGAEDASALEAFAETCAGLPEASSFLLHWDAGNLAKAAMQGAWERVSGAEVSSLPLRSLSRLFGPVGGVLAWVTDAAIGGAEGAWRLFGDVRDRADRLAEGLSEVLREFVASRRVSVLNLVGHSLGARILVHGGAGGGFRNLPLRDVVLMGGAVSWPESGVPLPSGARLFNLYSQTDGTLRLTREDCIGQSGLPDAIARKKHVRQIHCKGYGHTDYWPNLADLSRITGCLREGESTWLELAERLPMHDLQKRIHDFYLAECAGKNCPLRLS